MNKGTIAKNKFDDILTETEEETELDKHEDAEDSEHHHALDTGYELLETTKDRGTLDCLKNTCVDTCGNKCCIDTGSRAGYDQYDKTVLRHFTKCT